MIFEGFGRGKVILLGEHSVVYGQPALVGALNMGVRARIQDSTRAHTAVDLPDGDRLDIPAWGQSFSRRDTHPIAVAFNALLESYSDRRAVYNSAHGPIDVRVSLDIDLWPRAGLGCSAAMGVSMVEALDQLFGVERTPMQRAASSLVWEKVFHGTPSGIDSMAAAVGGVFLFQRGEPMPAVQPLVLRHPLHCAIAYSGEGADTAAMVRSVRTQWDADARRLDKTFEGIAALVRNAKLAIEDGDWVELGRLMTLNQWLLNALMVSTEIIQRLCDIAKDAGALGSKLTGSGGGGCVIALGRDRAGAERIQTAWTQAGYRALCMSFAEGCE